MTDSLVLAQTRYTAKAYDPNKKIPPAQFAKLLEILRLSPSSTNAQPWHFLIAESDAAKARIAKAMEGSDDYNIPKVLNASHVIVFCTLNDLTEAHLEAVTQAEIRAGRYSEAQRQANSGPRSHYMKIYREQGKLPLWAECQTHIALGQLLWAAASENIDSTAIGGFRTERLDAEFDLHRKGMHSTLVVCLGYHAPDDVNADKPKARLDADQIFTRL